MCLCLLAEESDYVDFLVRLEEQFETRDSNSNERITMTGRAKQQLRQGDGPPAGQEEGHDSVAMPTNILVAGGSGEDTRPCVSPAAADEDGSAPDANSPLSAEHSVHRWPPSYHGANDDVDIDPEQLNLLARPTRRVEDAAAASGTPAPASRQPTNDVKAPAHQATSRPVPKGSPQVSGEGRASQPPPANEAISGGGAVKPEASSSSGERDAELAELLLGRTATRAEMAELVAAFAQAAEIEQRLRAAGGGGLPPSSRRQLGRLRQAIESLINGGAPEKASASSQPAEGGGQQTLSSGGGAEAKTRRKMQLRMPKAVEQLATSKLFAGRLGAAGVPAAASSSAVTDGGTSCLWERTDSPSNSLSVAPFATLLSSDTSPSFRRRRGPPLLDRYVCGRSLPAPPARQPPRAPLRDGEGRRAGGGPGRGVGSGQGVGQRGEEADDEGFFVLNICLFSMLQTRIS